MDLLSLSYLLFHAKVERLGNGDAPAGQHVAAISDRGQGDAESLEWVICN